MTDKVETFKFEAEVDQVMSLIINSVYSSKEMFLRELISNASDAISKLVASKKEFDDKGYDTEFITKCKITMIPDKVNKTLTIQDTGIGMTKAELITFLGKVASSGTRDYKSILQAKNDKQNLDNLIGQFGLGFYSGFLVADKIDVITKSPTDEGYIWTSKCGQTSYEIAKYDTGDMKHGTSVVLHLKEGEYEYLDSTRLINLFKKHSQFVTYRVAIMVEKEVEEEKEEVTEIDGEATDTTEAKDTAEAKKAKKVIIEEQTINADVSVWNQKLDKIPEEDLKKFYKSISNDYDDYLAVKTWHYEGKYDMKLILFIPKRPKMNFFEQQKDKSNNLKIFNANVFVTDELSKSVVPDWMNFVVGAVSSSNFPMNISREFLQGCGTINFLKGKLPKCIAEMIETLVYDEEAYNKFYSDYSQNIKLAVRDHTGPEYERFLGLLRYPTNRNPEKLISLAEAKEELDKSQSKQLLYLTGLNKTDVTTSLYLEAFKDKLVLLMSEPVDEIMLQKLKEFEDIKLQNISVEGVECGTVSEDTATEYASFIEKIKSILKDKAESVTISTRHSTVPAFILSSKYGASATFENIIHAQPGMDKNPMLQMMFKGKKIFEINIENTVIKNLKALFDKGEEDSVIKYTNFLYNAAMVGCGYSIDNKSTFIRDLYNILNEAVTTSVQ